MLQIAICDDVKEQTISLQYYIRKYCKNHGIELELYVYTNGEELLLHIKKMDIIFLDIEMPGLDGIETGKEICRKNPACKIIMATRMIERMKEAFYIEAFRFITKPFAENEVEEALSSCLRKVLGSEKMLMYHNRILHNISQREIYYIVTYDSYSEVWTKDKMFRKEDSLKDLEYQLDDTLFFRIHRKYIVNMLYVESYKNGVVEIQGKSLPVSRRRRKEFEQTFIEFDIAYR
ncbi:MAG: response regulator transcription factor [Lachnospiraceae bacterium]|nr:response regulator transcription factor [Lachnospiraceae bacterium]